jgi:addiction module HigA family antidote
MKMYNPPHPGESIKGLWLDPMGVSITDAAQAMGVSRKTLSKIINGKARVTPEIAVRLSIALGARGYDLLPTVMPISAFTNAQFLLQQRAAQGDYAPTWALV